MTNGIYDPTMTIADQTRDYVAEFNWDIKFPNPELDAAAFVLQSINEIIDGYEEVESDAG